MLLTIDVGNSNLVAVVYDSHRNRVFDERIVTQKQNVIAYYEDWLIRLLAKLNHLNAIEGVIFSSVVPSITNDIVSIIKDKTNLDPMIVTTDLVSEFVIHLEERKHLGADFIATSYGAMADYPLPAIVADLGSATKISVLNAKGEFEGGVIVPGVGISVEALVGFIKHLPEIELKVPGQSHRKKYDPCHAVGVVVRCYIFSRRIGGPHRSRTWSADHAFINGWLCQSCPYTYA
jgi:type III pantothenate kinase